MAYYIYRLFGLDIINSSEYHYIGSTNKPVRRIKQHNNILKGEAKYTHSKLNMIQILCDNLYKWNYQFVLFTTMNRNNALSLEWNLKHPIKKNANNRIYSKLSKDINKMLEEIDLTLLYVNNKHNINETYILMLDSKIKSIYRPKLYIIMYITNLTHSIINNQLIDDMNELYYALKPTLHE